MNGRVIEAESQGGYLETEPGRFHVFFIVVNSATVQNIEEVLKVGTDVADIAAIRQEEASNQGGASQGDQ